MMKAPFFGRAFKKRKKNSSPKKKQRGKKELVFLRFVKVAQPAAPAISISNLGIFFGSRWASFCRATYILVYLSSGPEL
jgi:hypothetical protein